MTTKDQLFQSCYAAIQEAADLTDRMSGNGYVRADVIRLLALTQAANASAQTLERLMAGVPMPKRGE